MHATTYDMKASVTCTLNVSEVEEELLVIGQVGEIWPFEVIYAGVWLDVLGRENVY